LTAVVQQAAVVAQHPLVSDCHCQAALSAPGLETAAEHPGEDQLACREASRWAEEAELLTAVEACVQMAAVVADRRSLA